MNNEITTLTPETISTIRQHVMEWGIAYYKDFPWRSTNNAWHGLVAEIMLQRTRVVNVEPVYLDFVARFPDPTSVLDTPVEILAEVLYPLGLPYRTQRIYDLASAIVADHNRIPNDLSELIKLPGIGNYVASAWLSFHGNTRAILIDANVVRWLCRLIMYPMDGETRRKPWLRKMADDFTPEHDWKRYNYAVLDFTMEVCGRVPQCEVCPVGPELCLTGSKIIKSRNETT